jgi:hypothetical protein
MSDDGASAPPAAPVVPRQDGPPRRTDDELRERIATARWHATRYDSLRSSLTTRASFMVSVNAIIVAGTALLLTQSKPEDLSGGRLALAVAVFGAMITLAFSALSVRRAMGALVGRRPWRIDASAELPLSTFYQHSDTFQRLPDFASFAAYFPAESLEAQLDAAVVNLWVVMRAHVMRYAALRKAAATLSLAISTFAGSAVLVLALKVAKQFS